MNNTAQTLARFVLKYGSGYLTAIVLKNGWSDANTLHVIAVGFMAFVGLIWGILHRANQPGQTVRRPYGAVPMMALVGFCCLFFAANVRAQSTNANATAAQSAGQAVLDSVPGLNILTNLPSATFDQATCELFLGLDNTGSQLQNAVDFHYNFATNFFASAGLNLGPGSTVVNSFSLGVGARHAWQMWEVYGGISAGRDFNSAQFAGEVYGGLAWKPSSGLAVYSQIGATLTKKNFDFASNQSAPPLDIKVGIALPF